MAISQRSISNSLSPDKQSSDHFDACHQTTFVSGRGEWLWILCLAQIQIFRGPSESTKIAGLIPSSLQLNFKSQCVDSPPRAALADCLIINAIGLLSNGQPLEAHQTSALSIRCAVPASDLMRWLWTWPSGPLHDYVGVGRAERLLSSAVKDLCPRNEVFYPASCTAAC